MCALCGCPFCRRFDAAERMFGLAGRFPYAECERCGAVRLLEAPSNLAPYYPPGYYSFAETAPAVDSSPAGIRGWVRSRRNAAQVFGVDGLWGSLARRRPDPRLRSLEELFGRARLRTASPRVLDVGCGSGKLLKRLAAAGLRRLVGIDPFLDSQRRQSGGIELRRCRVEEVSDGPFDLVLFNHSLEHLPDQRSALAAVARLLSRDGICRIEIPTVTSDAYDAYRERWVELDAPRHFWLHSHESLRIVALKCGLAITSLEQVGTPFEFWGSELYRRDIALSTERGPRAPESVFSDEELDGFAERSLAANRSNRGGRIRVTLRRGADA
jgi:SAM-dependent methyltransferase